MVFVTVFCAVATFDGVCNGFLFSGDNCRIAESHQETFLTMFVRNHFTVFRLYNYLLTLSSPPPLNQIPSTNVVEH